MSDTEENRKVLDVIRPSDEERSRLLSVAECDFCGAEFERQRRDRLTCSKRCARKLADEGKRFSNRLRFDQWKGWTSRVPAEVEAAPDVAPMRNSCDLLAEHIAQFGERGDTEDERTAIFLKAYFETGNARMAAHLVGFPVLTHYARMYRNPEYAERVTEIRKRRSGPKQLGGSEQQAA